jgi:spoIIIJ-associated protein
MREIKFTGTDIDEALNKASEELNLTSDNIEFDIISLGSKGLFGVGKRPAAIKVFLKGEEKPFIKKKREVPAGNKKTRAPIKDKPVKKIEKRAKKEYKGEYKKPPVIDEAAQSDNIKNIADFVLRVVSRLDESAKVNASVKDDKIIVAVRSEDGGKIIGKGGRIINSVEYLTKKYARKVFGERVRLVVKIEDIK